MVLPPDGCPLSAPTEPFRAEPVNGRTGASLCGNKARFAALADSAWGEAALESPGLGVRGVAMHRFIDGEDRMQPALLPHCLEDYVGEENPVRVIEVFIDELDLASLGFSGMTPAATGRPYISSISASRRFGTSCRR